MGLLRFGAVVQLWLPVWSIQHHELASGPSSQRATGRAQRSLSQPTSRAAAQSKYRQTLRNRNDLAYSADISVGGQVLQAVMDTGSAELTVFSKDCGKCGTDAVFQPERSSTYRSGVGVAARTFGTGGTFAYETFEDISLGQLHRPSSRFWEVFDVVAPMKEDKHFQAVVGLGGPMTPTSSQNASFVEEQLRALGSKVAPARLLSRVAQAQSSNQTSAASSSFCSGFGIDSFSLCLGADSGSPGFLVWNDDTYRRSPAAFVSVPVEGKEHWAVNMTQARMGDQLKASLGCERGCAAVLDSSTSLLVGPPSAVRDIIALLQDLKDDCSNIDAMPELQFILGGHHFSLPPDAYIGRVETITAPGIKDLLSGHLHGSKVRCVPLVTSLESHTQMGPMWVLGLPFFRKYYTTFTLENQFKRELHFALTDDHCEPVVSKSLIGVARKNVAKSVDLNDIRIPHWLREAAASRIFTL